MGSFSGEPDFENGEWVDGEFYATGVKRRRSKHDNIYGVFGSDSEDEDAASARGGRRADAAGPRLLRLSPREAASPPPTLPDGHCEP